MSETRVVEIAGGGIAGLTVATLLARRGWRATVHERGGEIREVGSGLVIHNSSAVVFEELGILDEITEGATRFQRSRLMGSQGQLLLDKPLDGVSRMYNPMRSAVINAIYRAAIAAGVDVRTGSQVLRAGANGRLLLADGSERSADLVIAADGFHSAVRDGLPIATTKRTLGTGCTRTVIPRGEYDGEDMFTEIWSGTRRMGICPVSETETYVYFGCEQADGRASAVAPVDAAYWADVYPFLPSEFIERLDKGSAIRHLYPYVRCLTWSHGRVAVIGDALHALPPTLGQGVGLSVSNARALVETVGDLRSEAIVAALPVWEREARPVTDLTQDWSMRYERLSSAWPAGEQTRSWFLKNLPRKRLNRKLGAIDERSERWAKTARASAVTTSPEASAHV
jgi:2-polyprenyl-6-methoxyphenol hydroxylase-like FAD-dependent oxidoreductase